MAPADRLRFLDEATGRIARGMDVDETLLELRRVAVPAFADRVHVLLREPLAIGDETPELPVILLRQGDGDGAGAPPRAVHPSVTGPLAGLLLAGRPVFANAPGDAPAAAELLGPRVGGAPLPPPPGRRLIIAPLHARTHVIGALVLTRDAGRPPFTGDDLVVASLLATHTALGVYKAVLYGRDASVADALQRTMLPPSLPEPPGIRLASRYLPASKTARVGGDWYDAIPLPGNRVALVIGDVMGHSVTSAAIMGQLRTIVQTLAGLDLPPDEVLHHLDEQAERLGGQHIATCLYGVYDPALRRLVVANAGHPPPLLLHPDGRGEILRVPPGAPIGVGSGSFETTDLPAPSGSTLVLYTDGLVESRGADLLTGVEELLGRLRATTGTPTGTTGGAAGTTLPPLEAVCDEALGPLGKAVRDDDVALLAARFVGVLPETVAYWYLAPHPQTAGQARRLTRRTLYRWGLEHLVETSELLISEVVANAVRYANRPITLRLLRTDVLRCEIGDDSPLVPRMRHALLSDEGGRGLFLVDQLAHRWGATRLSTGKVVWFEQSLAGDGSGTAPL
ncbi:SpoIIE family protein phosphatase [Streptomyces sp. NPDC047000]|uniref:SpoIIE family protein phosphatase n=1 Tax=Streptomyces sp. NPDC047000 TaxID=3155474 RepID=UPI003406BE37